MESTTTLPDDLNTQSSRQLTDTGSRLDMLEQKWRMLDEKISLSYSAERYGGSFPDVFSPGRILSYRRGGAGTTPASLIARRGIAGRQQDVVHGGDGVSSMDAAFAVDDTELPLLLLQRDGKGLERLQVDCTQQEVVVVEEEQEEEEQEEEQQQQQQEGEARIVVGVEQLKREVDFLMEKKSRLERDTGGLKDELDIMVEQKRSARKELSELMYDVESARRALESLRMDMEKEQEEFMVGHRKMLSTMDLDLEERKYMAMNTIALEKKDAEEREREVYKKAVEVDARMKELHASEEELSKAREVLRLESKQFQKRLDTFQSSIATREAAVTEREKACEEMDRAAQRVLLREKEVAQREQELIHDASDVQNRYIDLEKRENALQDEKRTMTREKGEVVKEREELEVAKRLHQESVRRAQDDMKKEKESVIQRMEECQAREDALEGMGEEERRIEERRADLVAQVAMHTQDLDAIKSMIADEQDVLDRMKKEKVDLIRHNEALAQKEAELNELSTRVEAEDKALEAAKSDMEDLSKNLQSLISDIKAREDALCKEKALIDPQLKEISDRQAQLDVDFAALNDLMEDMENEGHELENRFECMMIKEGEFHRMKETWEKECSDKESLLQDVKETLDEREKDLDLRESRLESDIETHQREVKDMNATLERDRHVFEQHVAEQETQFAKDAKANAEERSQIAKEWQKIAEEKQVLAERSKQVTEREMNLQSEKERIERLHMESTVALNNADRMKTEVDMDKNILESREKRVMQLQKEAEALQAMVSEKNLIVSSALEKASQRESAAALKLQEAETMIQQAATIKEDADKKVSLWEKEVQESREKEQKAVQAVEHVKQDTLILQKSMESLKDLENHLREREWKLHESWKAIKAEASRIIEPVLNEPGSALNNILELDTLSKDAKRAEEDPENISILSNQKFNASDPGTFSKIYDSWAHATKKETVLQRWTVSLALESKRQKACEDRLNQNQKDFATQLADAKQHKMTAEKLMKEIEMKEIELENSIREYEISQKKLHADMSRLEHDSKELQKEQEELEAAKKELYCRESSIKSLEMSWKDRMSEVRDREKTVSDLQRRLAHHREALEDRESRLLEAEEKLRDDTMALSSKRSALDALETRLAKKESDLKEREADADALLTAARKEMEMASHVTSKSQARLIEIEERALELESVSDQIDDKMRHLQSLEEIADALECREKVLLKHEDNLHHDDMMNALSS